MIERTQPLVGISLIPNAGLWETLEETARLADEGDLDLIGIQDHPYQWRFLDTFALIGRLLARTERIHVFPDVACLPLRPPAMLGKTAASLAMLSGGRFHLGVGAGAFWDAIHAMGGPKRSPGESLAALDEAIAILRLMWSGERSIRYRGEHYVVDGIHPGVPPPSDIEIWVGGYGPRMLRLIGRLADGWIPSLGRTTLDRLRQGQAVIDEEAEARGRDRRSIRRLINVGGEINEPGPGDQGGPTRRLGALGGQLAGPPRFWQERLAELAEMGFTSFVMWLPDDPRQVARLAEEVAPAIRDRG